MNNFKAARQALGLSVSQMAQALGLKGVRTIRYYEAGKIEPSGPVQKLMAIYLEEAGLKPEDYGFATVAEIPLAS